MDFEQIQFLVISNETFNFYQKTVYVSDTHLPSKIDLYVIESEKVLLKYAYDNWGLYYDKLV